jgi:hypothetical protein
LASLSLVPSRALPHRIRAYSYLALLPCCSSPFHVFRHEEAARRTILGQKNQQSLAHVMISDRFFSIMHRTLNSSFFGFLEEPKERRRITGIVKDRMSGIISSRGWILVGAEEA